jgi:hypothetical protein
MFSMQAVFQVAAEAPLGAVSRSWRSGCATNVTGQMAVGLEAQDVHMFQRGGRLAGRCGLSVVIGRCVLGVRSNLNQAPAGTRLLHP